MPTHEQGVPVTGALDTNGRVSPLNLDSSGNLKVAVTGAGSGGTSSVDGATGTPGASAGTPAMAYVGTDTVAAGKIGIIRMLGNRQLTVTLYDSSGTEVTSFGGGTQYAEDTASANAQQLSMAGVVRRDSPTSPTSADGDRTELSVDASGQLYTKEASGAAILAATDGVEGLLTTIDGDTGILSGAIKAEDAAHVTADPGFPVLTKRTDSAATSAGTDGDYATLNTDASGRVWVNASGAAVPVTDNSGSLTVDNAGTFAVQVDGAALTSLQLIDDVVYTDDTSTHATGTSKGGLIMAAATPTDAAVDANDIGAVAMSTSRELHVKVTAALPAGSAAIGKLAANDGVDIGDVTINNTSGASAVNIQDGGNSITVDGTVAVSGSVAVTNAGTFVVQENGSQVQVDDAAFTPATSKIVMAGATFDDVAPDSVNEGDGGAIRMSANRNLYATLRDAAGNERGLNIDANGAIAATVTNATATNLKAEVIGTGTFAAQVTLAAGAAAIAKAEDVASADADVGVPAMMVRKATPANTSGTDGDYEFLQGSAGRLWTSAILEHGKSLKTVSGSVTSDTDIIAAVSTKKLKVYAYAFWTTGTNANTLLLKSNGTGGTELWRVRLQGVTSSLMGANLATSVPTFLFATVAGEKLTLDVSSGDTIDYSVAYWDDDAT